MPRPREPRFSMSLSPSDCILLRRHFANSVTVVRTRNPQTLFSPVRLGVIDAPNRILMAPLTRMRAGPDRVPSDLMVEYYRQRATAGLIVTEATAISRQGTGCPNTPGIYTDAHVAGWQRVTEAVHHASGRIYLQLWHMGRISHPSYQADGGLPVAPSAVAPRTGTILTDTGLQPYVVPRALETPEIAGVVEQYTAAAQRAKLAGFDGVEIHNANGYLLDQFLREGTNQRTDAYGGTVENRARLTLEVAEAVISVWDAGHVGIRFSPGGVFNDMHDSDPLATFRYVLEQLNHFRLAYAHLIVSTEDDKRHGAARVPLTALRMSFDGPLIVANGFNRETATRAVAQGRADAVAFGRLFLANPDLPERLRVSAPLNEPNESTFYRGGATSRMNRRSTAEARKVTPTIRQLGRPRDRKRRARQRSGGPLFLGIDTHALSIPAYATALEVLAANGVEVVIAEADEYTPTPVISHATLTHNRGRAIDLADGIVVTPSHNPPQNGGLEYNPTPGGIPSPVPSIHPRRTVATIFGPTSPISPTWWRCRLSETRSSSSASILLEAPVSTTGGASPSTTAWI